MTREDIAVAPIKRILKREHDRVSDEAAHEARDDVQRYAEMLANRASDAAEHGGRKTVQAGDVAFASDKMA